jgi:hypothetical protein
MPRRTNSARHQPNRIRAATSRTRHRVVWAVTATPTPCWMWPGCFSTPHERIVPGRTAPWWWCMCRPNSWPGTFPQQRRRRLRCVRSRVSVRWRQRPRKSIACDSRLLGAVVDRHGKVLALGRSRRLVSKAQRRALLIRDRMCQYPGCHQTRHLKAHHVVPWILGGRTDFDD